MSKKTKTKAKPEGAECSEKVLAIRARALIATLQLAESEVALNERESAPVTARELAKPIGARGNREARRRRVREAAAYAREVLGEMVCANGDGYWLARDVAEYTMYEEHRRANTRFAFVAAKKRRRAVSEKNTGQKLFGAKR